MNGISRRHGSISSMSTRLQSFLGSRLQTRLGKAGSTIYSMRWSEKVTPAGRQYCQLVASAPRISVNDCSSERLGWPTAAARDWKDTFGMSATGGGRSEPPRSTSESRFSGDRAGQDHLGWDIADWLGCRDGKFRPVEPGTQPLVNGIPRGLVPSRISSLEEYPSAARKIRLHGYGNAIVPQAAAEFITVFMEWVREIYLELGFI